VAALLWVVAVAEHAGMSSGEHRDRE